MKSEVGLDLGGIVWSLPSTGEYKSLDEQKIINVEGTYWTKKNQTIREIQRKHLGPKLFILVKYF